MRSLLVFLLLSMLFNVGKAEELDLENQFQNGTKALLLIFDAMNGATKPASVCESLLPGQKLRVSNFLGSSPTGVSRAYTITKKDSLNHALGFNFSFKPQDPNTTSEDENLFWWKRINSCMGQIGRLQASDGRFISQIFFDRDAPKAEIKIFTDLEALRKFVGEKEIGNAIAFSDKWYRGLTCSVLIHEILHHTGLVDEYADQDYIRRVVRTSIMSGSEMSELIWDRERDLEKQFRAYRDQPLKGSFFSFEGIELMFSSEPQQTGNGPGSVGNSAAGATAIASSSIWSDMSKVRQFRTRSQWIFAENPIKAAQSLFSSAAPKGVDLVRIAPIGKNVYPFTLLESKQRPEFQDFTHYFRVDAKTLQKPMRMEVLEMERRFPLRADQMEQIVSPYCGPKNRRYLDNAKKAYQ